MPKEFYPLCLNNKTDMAVTNRNQLLPCCYIDNPLFLKEPTIKKLAESSDISKHNSLEDIINGHKWRRLYKKLKEASESKNTKDVPWPCVDSCSKEQRREEWLKK